MTSVEEELGVSPFPHPPKIFYKKYSDENVNAGQAPPPPKPVLGGYSMFGARFDVSFKGDTNGGKQGTTVLEWSQMKRSQRVKLEE